MRLPWGTATHSSNPINSPIWQQLSGAYLFPYIDIIRLERRKSQLGLSRQAKKKSALIEDSVSLTRRII